MKKIITASFAALVLLQYVPAGATTGHQTLVQTASEKYDIKIKNDSGDEVTVYNAGSGGTYRLQKNVVTTIKMEDGDKLYIYEGGKKGRLLLTASSDLNGKLQLFSKL
jgi:hypothetical protein